MEILTFGPASSKVVNISLHGLPGIRSRQNREIAEAIALASDARTEVFLYAGLGVAPGVFNFKECIRHVEARVSEIVNESAVASVRLIGHSWGGYLALRMAELHSERVEKLVLMSPLLEFPREERALEGLRAWAAQHPEINFGDMGARAKELAELNDERTPFDFAAQLPVDIEVLFLQAKNDMITPEEHALRALKSFKRPPVFEFIETDHSFLIDRPRIARRISDFIVSKPEYQNR